MTRMNDPSIDQALRNDAGRVIYGLRSRNAYAVSYIVRAAEKMGAIEELVAARDESRTEPKYRKPEEEIKAKASENIELSAVDEIKAKIDRAKESKDPKTGKRILATSRKSYRVIADDIMDDIDVDQARQKIMSLYEGIKS